jgi:hypothetical protein
MAVWMRSVIRGMSHHISELRQLFASIVNVRK